MKRIKVYLMLIAALLCVALPSFAPTKKLFRTKMADCDTGRSNGTSVIMWFAGTVEVSYVIRGFDAADEVSTVRLHAPALGDVVYELCGGASGTECPDLQIEPTSGQLYVTDNVRLDLNNLLSPPLPTPGKKGVFLQYLDDEQVYIDAILTSGECQSNGGPYRQIFP